MEVGGGGWEFDLRIGRSGCEVWEGGGSSKLVVIAM